MAVVALAVLGACGRTPPPPMPSPADVPAAGSGAASAEARVRSLEQAIVGHVRAALGSPYRLGGKDASGFDCSGLIQSAYAAQGFPLPRISRDQARAGREVPRDRDALRPGDILAFASDGRTVTHVGMYIGNGRFIHSAGAGVRESVLDERDPDGRWYLRRWVAARRVLPDPAWPTVESASDSTRR
jgi:cell wall-associated NlpC family hydrolase